MSKKTKKAMSMLLVVALIAVIAVGGMLAYLTSEDSDVNVMTLGNVEIDQIEQERDANGNLVDFKQEKPLYPAVYDDITWADTGVNINGVNYKVFDASVKNVQDKIVTVKNTGKSDAYIRTLIAFEAPEGFNDDLLHINYNGDAVKLGEWKYITVEGVRYVMNSFTYYNPVAAGTTSAPSLVQVFLDKATTNEDIALLGETYEILVLSQATQTAGFESNPYARSTRIAAEYALDTAFGEVTKENAEAWFKGMTVPTYVSTVAELADALADGGNIALTANIELTETLEICNTTATIDAENHVISVADGASFDHMFKIGNENAEKNTSVIFENVIVDGENTKRLLSVQKSAEVTIGNGAIFRNGRGVLGAGATVVGELNLAGGTIENCKCLQGSSPGGAVYIGGGIFNMSAGKIAGCENWNHGSAVGFLWSGGEFNMSGGVIENCTNSNNKSDAAVYLGHADAVANITGGRIINNTDYAQTTEAYATGIDTANGVLNVSGRVEISNESGKAGLYVNTNPVQIKSMLESGTKITLNCNVIDKVIAKGASYTLTEADLAAFDNIAEGCTLKLEENQIKCVAE